MPEQTITVTLPRKQAEVLALPEGHGRDDWEYHHLRGNGLRTLRATLDNPQPESYTRERVLAALQSHAAMEAGAKALYEHYLFTELDMTGPEWLVDGGADEWALLATEVADAQVDAALSAAFPDQQPEPLDERQERLEAEPSDTEAAIERKRQEDGP